MKRIALLSAAAFALVALSVAPLTGCKASLEQGGAYAPASTIVTNGVTNTVATSAPEMDLYVSDNAFNLAVDSLQVIFKTERDNRALIQQKAPGVKKALDQVRVQAVAIMKDYGQARAAYRANPIPPNLDTVNGILSKVQQLLSVGQAALPPDLISSLTGPKNRAD